MKYIVLACAILFLSAADLRQQNPVAGTWQWVKSINRNRGAKEPRVRTPKNTKRTIRLEIDATEIHVFENEKSSARLAYLMYTLQDGEQVIRVSQPENDDNFVVSSGIVKYIADTLLIAGGYNDAGEDQYYLRTRSLKTTK